MAIKELSDAEIGIELSDADIGLSVVPSNKPKL